MFEGYDVGPFYDEMLVSNGAGGLRPRLAAELLVKKLLGLRPADLDERQRAADQALLNMGITFNVYGDADGTEKIFPFDLLPRVLDSVEWERLERGLKQRVQALNAFVADVYGQKRIFRDKVIPEAIVLSAASYFPACEGLKPPRGVFCHIVGTDLVRDRDGTFYVLEDNLRCPSGVSYVLQNRQVMKRTFPQVFAASHVMPVDHYPTQLLKTLRAVAPRESSGSSEPTVAVLTPGMYNAAYFEHAFLAQQMGVELVEGRDLVVKDGYVQMRTTRGFQRVDVIYRRIDDSFLDPEAFRRDSCLGVPGIMQVYREGRVTLANAPGNGVADDKVVYSFVPKMIRYYLGEDPILPNVPTFVCDDAKERAHVLANLATMVVKAANESGGYGMLVGPQSTEADRMKFRGLIEANPRNYIAQPVVSLSRVPTLCDGKLQGRHVDLRPYILMGEETWVLPGGLTRVALKPGSLVVNSSQGGGSKDTWVVNRVVDSHGATSQSQSQSQGGEPRGT